VRTTFTCLASILLITFGVSAQGPSAAPRTAKDEAVPELRDARTIVLRHVRVIDGTGAPPREDQTLTIQDGKIAALRPDDAVEIPQDGRTLDLSGRTVLPGLVMLHEHLFMNDPGDGVGLSHPQHFSYPRLYLAYGATTIRTAGSDYPYMDLNLKRRIDAGTTPGPEIHLTSPYFSGEGDPVLGAMILRDPESARRAVRYWAAEGFTSFKAYQWIPKDVLAALIDEAHKLKLPVTAHLGSVSCLAAAQMGIDNLEHAFGPCIRRTADNLEPDLNGPRTQQLVRALVDKHVVLTATPRASDAAADVEGPLLDPSVRDRLSRLRMTRPRASGPAAAPGSYNRLLKAFVNGGGRLVLGSDAGSERLAGLADHEALKGLVRMGFEPVEAMRIATLNGATFLGIQDRTGSLQVGKEADIVVVRGNPANRIEDIEHVQVVFNNGVAYDPKTLIARVKGEVGWK
jgi:imidazolonepropionase-like amidohydrolase